MVSFVFAFNLEPHNFLTLSAPKTRGAQTVVDKVKDFFGDARESFGKLTSLETPSSTEADDKS